MRNLKQYLLVGFVFIGIAAVLAFTIAQNQKQQENRSKAGRGDAVSFSVSPNTASKNVNDTFDVDLFMDANGQSIAGVDLTFTYDPTLLEVTNPRIDSNTQQNIFNTPLMANVNNTTGTIRIAAVNQSGNVLVLGSFKVGTITVKAKAAGSGRVTLTSAQVVGTGLTNALGVNGLNSALGTYTITGGPTIPVPTGIPPTDVPPTGIPSPQAVQLTFTVALTGVTNDPAINPVHPQPQFIVQLFDSQERPVGTDHTGLLTFNTQSRLYTGTIDVGTLPSASYIVKIKTNRYLRKKIPGFFTLAGGTNTIPQIEMTTGNANNDSELNIQDFNKIRECQGKTAVTAGCSDADANDDGLVGPVDLALYVRYMGVRHED